MTKDLTGQRFGRWTVIARATNYVAPCGTIFARWICRCKCGNERILFGRHLRHPERDHKRLTCQLCHTIKVAEKKVLERRKREQAEADMRQRIANGKAG